MGLVRRVLSRAVPQVDRRIDWRVDAALDEKVVHNYARQGDFETVRDDLAAMSEKLLFTMSELRRWMVDDLQAANETAVLLGESLTRLQATVDRLGEDVAGIRKRLEP